jgi:hypothetical protein
MRPFIRTAAKCSSTPVKLILMFGAFVAFGSPRPLLAQEKQPFEYRVLATSKTSTMEKELNEAGETGFSFEAVMVATRLSAEAKWSSS